MLDDVQEPQADKVPVTPKPERKAAPVCIVMDDGNLEIATNSINPLELHGLLLSAASRIPASILQRTIRLERLVAQIDARFGGFDEETEREIRQLTGRA